MSLARKDSAAGVRSPLYIARKTCGRAIAARGAHLREERLSLSCDSAITTPGGPKRRGGRRPRARPGPAFSEKTDRYLSATFLSFGGDPLASAAKLMFPN